MCVSKRCFSVFFLVLFYFFFSFLVGMLHCLWETILSVKALISTFTKIRSRKVKNYLRKTISTVSHSCVNHILVEEK